MASRIFEIDSVEGQRSRPLAEERLDLLKVVESSPALRARPEAVAPWAEQILPMVVAETVRQILAEVVLVQEILEILEVMEVLVLLLLNI